MLKAYYIIYFFDNRYVSSAKTLCHSWCFNEKNKNKKIKKKLATVEGGLHVYSLRNSFRYFRWQYKSMKLIYDEF